MIDLLNQEPADVLDLGLQSKQAHWNVKGPQFIGLHKLFDKVADELEELTDDMAERAITAPTNSNPSVLFWRNSSNTVTEQNIFINVDRAVAYGLDN